MPASGTVLRVAAPSSLAVEDVPVVDDWGRDEGLIRRLAPLAHLRWDVCVSGFEHLPGGGALIIVNTVRFALTPLAAAWAIGEEIGRPVRFVGRPDVVPFGPVLRRSGALLAQPGEVAGALRAGELVIIGAAATTSRRTVGRIDPTLVAPAMRERVPVHVASVTSAITSRHVHVDISPAVRTTRARRGPLAEVELAEIARRRLQEMLSAPMVVGR